MKKKRLGLAMIITAILLPASAYLLWRGIVRFNYPSEAAFPIRGIDVSHHQGQVNWSAVAADGIHFTYIKASEGEFFKDQRFSCRYHTAPCLESRWTPSTQSSMPFSSRHCKYPSTAE